jgi:exopolysaccharide biosynthesis polyprenyl glycosylphosphotransferase
VNATERAALLRSVEASPEETFVDERTLDVVEHRRRTSTVRRRGWLIRRMLLLADVVGLLAAFALAQALFRLHTAATGTVDTSAELLIFALSLPGWIVVAKLYGVYDHDEERTDHSTADDIVPLVHILTISAWLFYGGSLLTHVTHPSFLKLFVFWALAIAFLTSGRAGARAFCRRQVNYIQNTIIVGAGDIGQLVAKKLLNHPEYGINLVGFVDDMPKERRDDLEHLTLLGGPDRLPALVHLFDVERVIIAFSAQPHEETLDLIRSMKDLDVQVDIVPRLFELVGTNFGVHTVEGLPLVGLAPPRLSNSSLLLKRALDLAVTIPALLLLAPLFGLVALLIKRDSRGPVLFRQVRMGSGNKTFEILKFRTMVTDAEALKPSVAHLNQHLRPGGDARMFKIADDPRVTRIGRVLRRYSLDELPQLWNVLRGEMSLVGPRPLILAEDAFVTRWARQRLNLKPGCTGPWQVMGRSGIPFDEMVRIDYLYVNGWSLFHDLKLILRTLPVLTSGRN